MSINVAAEGETYIEAFGSLEGYAGGDAHAITAIGFCFVGDSYAGEVGQLAAGAAAVAEELVVPSDGGVGLPVCAVIAI